MEAIEHFRRELGVERCVPVVHDWGGLIGLRWACEHPEAVSAARDQLDRVLPRRQLARHGRGARTPGTGEEMIGGHDREGFGGAAARDRPGFDDDAIDEYWKASPTRPAGAAQLEFCRSADFEKLRRLPLAELGVPTLLLWGENDPFAPSPAPTASQREIPEHASWSSSTAPATSSSRTRPSAPPPR